MSDNFIDKKTTFINNNESFEKRESVLKEKPVLNSDKIQIHEFTRENIVAPFNSSVDHFTYKSENDIKYDFLKTKYFFSSHTMLKAFYWSIGIGTTFFLHRFYRKQILMNSIRWGLFTMSTSFLFLWGNFEIQPFVMSYYYSNYITELSVQDLSKNLNENMKENRNFDHYNKLKDLKMDVIFEEDNFLGSFEKTIKQLEDKITICSDLTDDNNENLCNVDYKIFIKFENFDNFPDLTEIQIRKYNILKNEINLTKSNDQMDYVRRCLFNTQNYLRSSENALYENDEFYIKILE